MLDPFPIGGNGSRGLTRSQEDWLNHTGCDPFPTRSQRVREWVKSTRSQCVPLPTGRDTGLGQTGTNLRGDE